MCLYFPLMYIFFLPSYIGLGLTLFLTSFIIILILFLTMPYVLCLDDYNRKHKPPFGS